jgi:hypothetical protein
VGVIRAGLTSRVLTFSFLFPFKICILTLCPIKESGDPESCDLGCTGNFLCQSQGPKSATQTLGLDVAQNSELSGLRKIIQCTYHAVCDTLGRL